MNRAADTILYNGKIISCDNENSIYQAIGIKDECIVALGSNDEILDLKGQETRLIDLEGKTVIPGLIETHSHLSWSALSEARGELFIPQSVKELLDYIRERVQTIEKGEWLYFRNTYPTRLDEYRFPTIEELDEVAPDNPVYVDGAYAGQVNSCALRIAGIDQDTVVSEGRLCRNPVTGKLNGTIFICGDLFKKHIKTPQYTHEEALDAIVRLQKSYNALGVTSLIDGMTSFDSLKSYNRMYQNGLLNMRLVYTYMAAGDGTIDEDLNAFSSSILIPEQWGKLSFLKVGLDGGILTGTSYMRKPYGDGGAGVFGIDDKEFRGIIKLGVDKLVEYINKAMEKGIQMTAHCIGDAATDRFLAAYEKVQKYTDIRNRRFSIIHADFTDTETLEKIKDLGLILLSQPAWHYKDGSILNMVLDEETMRTFLPYRDMEALGVRVAAGSDHMVKHDSFLSQNPYNPFLGMYNLVTRKTCRGEVIGGEQKVSRQKALRMYTLDGAYATFDEKVKGSLEKGKFADLAVLSKDFFTCPEEEIPQIESVLTMVGGRIVYSKDI